MPVQAIMEEDEIALLGNYFYLTGGRFGKVSTILQRLVSYIYNYSNKLGTSAVVLGKL